MIKEPAGDNIENHDVLDTPEELKEVEMAAESIEAGPSTEAIIAHHKLHLLENWNGEYGKSSEPATEKKFFVRICSLEEVRAIVDQQNLAVSYNPEYPSDSANTLEMYGDPIEYLQFPRYIEQNEEMYRKIKSRVYPSRSAPKEERLTAKDSKRVGPYAESWFARLDRTGVGIQQGEFIVGEELLLNTLKEAHRLALIENGTKNIRHGTVVRFRELLIQKIDEIGDRRDPRTFKYNMVLHYIAHVLDIENEDQFTYTELPPENNELVKQFFTTENPDELSIREIIQLLLKNAYSSFREGGLDEPRHHTVALITGTKTAIRKGLPAEFVLHNLPDKHDTAQELLGVVNILRDKTATAELVEISENGGEWAFPVFDRQGHVRFPSLENQPVDRLEQMFKDVGIEL